MRNITRFVLGGLLVASSASLAAAELTVEMKARIIGVNDPGNVLGGQAVPWQLVDASYTYDTSVADQDSSWNYGIYPQPQGRVKVTIGSHVFENDAAAEPWSRTVAVHPSDWPGYYQGFFRFPTFANKPLANGATVSVMDLDFSDFAGNAPLTDALPTGAPDLQKYQQRRLNVAGELNGQYFSVSMDIESAQVASASGGSALVVSPGKSTLVVPLQRFDIALLLPAGSGAIAARATENGMPLPLTFPGSCFMGPVTQQGGPVILCPDSQWRVPAQEGVHTIRWQVDLVNGTTLESDVEWTVVR